MTAQISGLLRLQDNRDTIEAKIAQILVEESAAQVAMAATGAIIEYTRADESDYIVTPTHAGIGLGAYTVTAGTLTDGVGKWTLLAPDGETTEEHTTTDADGPLVFTVTGLTLAVTPFLSPFETGDVITATVVEANDYRVKVYSGWCNPIHNWLEATDLEAAETVPRVQVWFDRQRFDKGRSDLFTSQQGPGVFFVDVYGYGRAYETDAGHVPAGTAAGAEVRRALSFVWQALMAAHYVTLGLQGTVAQRFPDSVEFMPEQLTMRVQANHVVAARLTLEVEFAELAPQVTGVPLEIIATTIYRQEDGEVLATATQDWSS
jgi:hypothetical protein